MKFTYRAIHKTLMCSLTNKYRANIHVTTQETEHWSPEAPNTFFPPLRIIIIDFYGNNYIVVLPPKYRS